MDDIMNKVDTLSLLSEININELKSMSLFGALSEEAIYFLLHNGEAYQTETGDVLFRAGDPTNGFYIILQGSIAFTKSHHKHKAYIRDYHVGEPIGIVGMITLQNRIGDAVVKKPGYVLKVSEDNFQQLYENESEDFVVLLINVIRSMARGVEIVDDRLVDETTNSYDIS